MRQKLAWWLSLGLNAALLAVLILRNAPPTPPAPTRIGVPNTTSPPVVKTNVVVRRQNFTWSEVESEDFRIYITRLRAIGCPESTIRDIILAEVNALYDRKRAEIPVPEQPWWRVDPTQSAAEAVAPMFAALETERRAMLTELLGPGWEPTTNEEWIAFNLKLDGPVLSGMPLKTKMALRDIETRATQRQQQYLTARANSGEAPDPGELERLRQEVRAELAQLLTPEQLEAYLVRYSQTAQTLRNELQRAEITPDEFRALFRTRDSLDQQIRLAGGTDPTTIVRRIDLERQREAAMRQILGEDRYRMLRFAQDPLFRQAQTSVQQIGAPPETVLAIYQINQATEAETQRIRNDASMTLEERATALAQMLTQKEESLRRILGTAIYERYRQQAQQ